MITYIGTDAGRKNKTTTTKQNTVFVIYLRVVYNLFYQILSDYQGSLVLLIRVSTLRFDHVTEFYLILLLYIIHVLVNYSKIYLTASPPVAASSLAPLSPPVSPPVSPTTTLLCVGIGTFNCLFGSSTMSFGEFIN